MMTSDTWLGSIDDRLRASLIVTLPNSHALNDESFPQKEPEPNSKTLRET